MIAKARVYGTAPKPLRGRELTRSLLQTFCVWSLLRLLAATELDSDSFDAILPCRGPNHFERPSCVAVAYAAITTIPCMPCQRLHMSSTVQQSAAWRLAGAHLRLKRCTSQNLSTGESQCATAATSHSTNRVLSPQQAIRCTGQKQPRRLKAKAEENGSSKSSQEAALQVRTEFCLMVCPPVNV